ncbi:transposase family protein [Micromonospora olivasterospora]|uniref:transposase family protein n=1 Tax=Micromonospora olivasterospora TaxID=1880 RepID=UPI0031CE563D
MADPWTTQQESRLRERRGRDRIRAAGAGPDHDLTFTDRVIATLVVLRFQLPHAALALFYNVDRATITRAVDEIRPLPAARGFAVPGMPGVRLRTLADVFAYAAAQGVELQRRAVGAAQEPGSAVRHAEGDPRLDPGHQPAPVQGVSAQGTVPRTYQDQG